MSKKRVDTGFIENFSSGTAKKINSSHIFFLSNIDEIIKKLQSLFATKLRWKKFFKISYAFDLNPKINKFMSWYERKLVNGPSGTRMSDFYDFSSECKMPNTKMSKIEKVRNSKFIMSKFKISKNDGIEIRKRVSKTWFFDIQNFLLFTFRHFMNSIFLISTFFNF